MKLAWAFFKRDAMIALSYRLDFVFQILGRLVLIIIFYFIVKSISGVRDLSPAGFQGGLFAYILVGIAFADCISISMTVFAKQIREGQVTGSLEVTPAGPGASLRDPALFVPVGLCIQRGAVSFLSCGGVAVSRRRFVARQLG